MLLFKATESNAAAVCDLYGGVLMQTPGGSGGGGLGERGSGHTLDQCTETHTHAHTHTVIVVHKIHI